MAQHDFNIANQSFPSFRTDLNNALSAINTSQSGTSRPSGAVAGTIWLDTTSATTPTLKYYDGADDISLATLDHSANTVNWLDSTVSITGLSTTATGTVLTLNDTNLNSTVSIRIPTTKGIDDDSGNEFLKFTKTATAVNEFTIVNSATGSAPEIQSTGDDTNIDLKITPKGTGKIILDGLAFPNADGSASQVLQTNGSGVLSFSTISAGGITEADQWRLSAAVAAAADAEITTNFERNDTNSFDKIGTGMTESSGTFTFPSTGIYFVQAVYGCSGLTASRFVGCQIMTTINNSSYTTAALNYSHLSLEEGDATYITILTSAIIDVTSTANVKCKFRQQWNQLTNNVVRGGTTENNSHFTFIRLGDT
jgi:hypothetical protein